MTQDQIMALVDVYATQMMHAHYHPLMESRAAVVAEIEQLTKDAEKDVLEQAAKRCEAKHVNGNWRYDTRYECAAAIREMIGEIK